MSKRTDISSFLRNAAVAVALVCLAACDVYSSPQARVDACVRDFADTLGGLRDVRPRSGGTVRYAFELRNPDPALERDGIEGVRPSRFTYAGSDSPAEVPDAVDRLMNSQLDPETISGPSLDIVIERSS